jgi:hypothetical protein
MPCEAWVGRHREREGALGVTEPKNILHPKCSPANGKNPPACRALFCKLVSGLRYFARSTFVRCIRTDGHPHRIIIVIINIDGLADVGNETTKEYKLMERISDLPSNGGNYQFSIILTHMIRFLISKT